LRPRLLISGSRFSRNQAVPSSMVGEPGSPPVYVAMCHMSFDSLDAFQAVFAPSVETFQKDVPNYTDIEPTVQISEVKL